MKDDNDRTTDAVIRPWVARGPTGLMSEALSRLDGGWTPRRLHDELRDLRRALDPAHGITSADVSEIRSRLARGSQRPRVLIESRDAIIRSGLDAALTGAGVLSWAAAEHLDPADVSPWDYVLVWLRAREGLDPYHSIRFVRSRGERFLRTPIVAVHDRPVPLPVKLRLAEAGFRYLVPLTWLSDAMPEIATVFSTASIPLTFHLATPLALREQMGMRLSGDLEAFLERALELPEEVWTGHLPQSHLPIPRSTVQRMRQLSRELAGLAPPDFAVYATSAFRRPPVEPEWPRVRDLVRTSLDL